MREKILLLFLLLSTAVLVYLYFRNPRVFVLFFRTMRASRHAYYTVIFAAGYLLGVKISGTIFNTVVFVSGILLMNVLFASSLAINNVYDKKIDALNDKDNILNSSGLGLHDYYILFFSLMGVSLVISTAVSFMVLLLAIVIHITSWIYSSPPLHLKKVFILNTLLIAFSTLLAMALGFAASSGSVVLFPPGLAFTVIIVLTLAFNTKDVNDYKGDKKHGVKTIVTVFGQKKGRMITAVLAFAGYLLVPVLLNAYGLLIPSAAFGGITYAVINTKKRRINETLIFGLFFAFAAVFAFVNPNIR